MKKHHELKNIYVSDQTGQYKGSCTCGQPCGPAATKQELRDNHTRHLRYIERVRNQIGKKDPSLKDQHAYYCERAADPELDQAERDQWALLASEAGHRLGLYAPPSEQMSLGF